MEGGQHFDGVPLEQLMLVRVQAGLDGVRADERGNLVLSQQGSGREDSMNTFHFALNGPVTNHVLGRFDFPIAIISPLAQTCLELGQKPAGLDGADTYFHADAKLEMTLADATIVAPMGTPIPEGFGGRAIFYVPGHDQQQMLTHRNEAVSIELAGRDVPEKQVAPVGWRHRDRTSSPEEYRELGRALGCPDLRRRSHMNAPDGVLEQLRGMFRGRVEDFARGERVHANDAGTEEPILDVCERLVSGMHREIQELRGAVDCPRAEAFYAPKIRAAETVLERMRVVRARELQEAAQLDGPPILPIRVLPPVLPSGALMSMGAMPLGAIFPPSLPRTGREADLATTSPTASGPSL